MRRRWYGVLAVTYNGITKWTYRFHAWRHPRYLSWCEMCRMYAPSTAE